MENPKGDHGGRRYVVAFGAPCLDAENCLGRSNPSRGTSRGACQQARNCERLWTQATGDNQRKGRGADTFPIIHKLRRTIANLSGRGTGALGEIRTPDPRIRSPMLYPAELRARTLRPISRLGREGPAITTSQKAANIPSETTATRKAQQARGIDGLQMAGSEAGITSALRAIDRRSLIAIIVGRPIVIGESAGH
jgi:hypothetical protein